MDETSFEPMPDPRVGSLVRGRYRIVRLLGEGGMGAVYEAQHELIRRRCALKFLHAQYARTPATLTRFRREALAATATGNPHIVEVLDMDQAEDGAPFLVLEFLEGRSLADEVERTGPMAVARALAIMEQLCFALGDVHRHGIVHRDLKPENLFLTTRFGRLDFVKVLDFGVSKFTTSQDGLTVNLTSTGAAVGSVYFMSPEQARGRGDVDARSDVYALGGVLFYLLAGRPVFEGDSLPGLLMQIVSDPPPLLRIFRDDVPHHVSAAIERALQKDPALRFETCADFWQALCGEDVALAATRLADSQGPVRPSSPVQSLAKNDVPRRWRGRSWLVLAFLMLVGLGFLLLGPERKPNAVVRDVPTVSPPKATSVPVPVLAPAPVETPSERPAPPTARESPRTSTSQRERPTSAQPAPSIEPVTPTVAPAPAIAIDEPATPEADAPEADAPRTLKRIRF